MQTSNPYIFYSDDDDDDQELFRDALGEVDDQISLITADDGDELLNLLKAPPPYPNIIFLDLNMPRVNGYQVLERMRQDETMKNYPVVIFSTSSNTEAVEKTRKMGANLFVPKPRNYDAMKRAIKTCVSIDWTAFDAEQQPYLVRFN